MNGKELEPKGFASMYPLWYNAGALDDRLTQLAELPLMQLANDKAVSVDIAEDVRNLFEVFSDKRIKKVPVVNQGKLVGVVSRSDLLRQMVGQSSLFTAQHSGT